MMKDSETFLAICNVSTRAGRWSILPRVFGEDGKKMKKKKEVGERQMHGL